MANDITCNVCGGTDFTKESGFYYCNECQTQSQDVREHVFAVSEEAAAEAPRQTSSRRIRTPKATVDQLTSWECYNYIVLGLVNELIELGADSKLKQTVHLLWLKYLKELEVISDKPNAPPKLSAVNSKKDAQIVYRRPGKKRKSSRTPSPSASSDLTSLDSQLLRREKAKKRRTMVLAEYDELSNTMQSEDVSLHNQSLVSLRTASDTSSKDQEKFLQYNKSAKKELLRIMTKNHLKSHCRDIDSILDCHKITYRSVTSKYSHGVKIISRNKIYALIYLGLLINKDKIQLGDVLRFIREGSLSFHYVYHFFPEDFSDKSLNIRSWNEGPTLPTHRRIREVAAEMARYLGVTKYIPRQNLLELCQRYCIELNLPEEVMGYTANLMSRVLPKMHLTTKSKFIPNYEGRTISMIMFIMKLIFGVDDVTENEFTTYAEKVNNLGDTALKKMFVWKDWMYYINYRKLILIQHHFPTQYLFSNENLHNSDIFIKFLTEQNSNHEQDHRLSSEAHILKRLLEKLNDRESEPREGLNFKSTLTPFRSYLETLLESSVPVDNNYLIDVLKFNFKNDSLAFLVRPFSYVERICEGSRIGVKHRGVNDLEMIKIPNFKVRRQQWRKSLKKTTLVRLDNKAPNNNEDCIVEKPEIVSKLKTKEIIKNFEERHKKSYRNGLKKLLRLHEREKREHATQSQEMDNSFVTYRSEMSSQGAELLTQITQSTENIRTYIHYNPYERYWLKSIYALNLSKEQYQEFIVTFPESFRLLLNECARVTEQHPKDLFEEFTDVEVYLCYVAEFIVKDKHRNHIVNKELLRFINKAKKNW